MFKWGITALAKVFMLYVFSATAYWILEETFCVLYPSNYLFGITFLILFIITFILGRVMFAPPKRF
jgi:uncharacterized phage infection (PIP) family protein YhgE